LNKTLEEDMVSENDDVLLFLSPRRTYLVRARRGEKFHTHKGFIQLDDILGKRFGDKVTSNMGYLFYILRPSVYDYLEKSARSTQIVYLKDAALIAAYAGIGPGSRVIEAGTGSGALTTILANHVRPDGRVYSYDVRAEFQEKAKRNLLRAGVADFVDLKIGDVADGFSERGVNAVVLDLATPWLIVPKAYEALQGGGHFVSFSPTIEQTIKTVSALQDGFVDVETVECISRRFKVKEGETRPETLMVGHTGYITHARKVFKE